MPWDHWQQHDKWPVWIYDTGEEDEPSGGDYADGGGDYADSDGGYAAGGD